MNKAELKKWLEDKKFSVVILVCPRCGHVDIDPQTHLDECDPLDEQMRQEAQNYYD